QVLCFFFFFFFSSRRRHTRFSRDWSSDVCSSDLTYFRELAIDVVHVQTEFGLAHAAAAVARTMGVKVVHTVHTFYWASDGGWHRSEERRVGKECGCRGAA